MSDVNIFEQASRIQLRFATNNGALNVEDLWVLPLTSTKGRANLDNIAQSLSQQVAQQSEHSFVTTPAAADKDLVVAFEVVKAIIKVRLEENAVAATIVAKAKQKQVLVDALAAAQGKELGAKTPAEIQAMIAEL